MSNDDVVEVCNVRVVARCRETGAALHERVGHNVWTNTGREYSCMLKTYAGGRVAIRSDRIAYVGLGTGAQPEAVGVTRLVRPVQWKAGVFLKELDHAATTFPVIGAGARTAVRYVVRFETQHIALASAPVFISECGLFTDGDAVTFAAGQRDQSIQRAEAQSPIAYHSFDPIPKTDNIELEITWELRH